MSLLISMSIVFLKGELSFLETSSNRNHVWFAELDYPGFAAIRKRNCGEVTGKNSLFYGNVSFLP